MRGADFGRHSLELLGKWMLCGRCGRAGRGPEEPASAAVGSRASVPTRQRPFETE